MVTMLVGFQLSDESCFQTGEACSRVSPCRSCSCSSQLSTVRGLEHKYKQCPQCCCVNTQAHSLSHGHRGIVHKLLNTC